MSNKVNTPIERKMKRDYFFIGVYSLVVFVMMIQFFVIFLIDILDNAGLI